MPKFVKTNTIVEVNRHGIETDRQVLFTDDEVVSRVLLNPSLVIEVTESHAAQVVRPQQNYQELSEDTLIEIDAQRAAGEAKIEEKASKPAKPSKPATDTDDDELDSDTPLTFGKGK